MIPSFLTGLSLLLLLNTTPSCNDNAGKEEPTVMQQWQQERQQRRRLVTEQLAGYTPQYQVTDHVSSIPLYLCTVCPVYPILDSSYTHSYCLLMYYLLSINIFSRPPLIWIKNCYKTCWPKTT